MPPALLDDVLIGARLLARLPGFLRAGRGFGDGRALLERRLRSRSADFLALVRQGVFGQRASPYRALFRGYGCEYGDLERLVAREGLEGALGALLRGGVYLTLDELKGRAPVVRGSTWVMAGPRRLRNPAAARHLPMRSSGSSGRRTTLAVDLAFVREASVDYELVLQARGVGDRWRHASWGVPGGADLYRVVRCLAVGRVLDGWFWQVDPAQRALSARYRWSTRLLRLACLLGGRRLPRPVAVPSTAPRPLVEWMAGILRRGAVPHLMTSPSAAVRLAEAAAAAGVDLAGAQLSVGGEPMTAARLAAIGQVGARAVPQYAATEFGVVLAAGCLAPRAADELHLVEDMVAAVQPGAAAARRDVPADALLLSAVRPRAPLVLINVALGDRAALGSRACGCPLEGLGWTTHVQGIRSHRQLTAGGMTVPDRTVEHILEHVLPRRFGGVSADYQLIEEEEAGGHPRLTLLVHPRVGVIEEREVTATFLNALGEGPGRVIALQWRDAGFLKIERRAPTPSAGGKVLLVSRVPPAAAPAASGGQRAGP